MSLRIVYMGTPDFAVLPLEALVAGGYTPVAVVSQPDKQRGRSKQLSPTPVKAAALAADIPVLTPAKVNTPEALAEISAYRPDLLVVVAYGQILRQGLLDLAPLGAVNLHASLLPAYRGAAPIHRVVIDGQTVSGVTTMYLDSGVDTGDMILKETCPVGPDQTTGELHDRLAEIGSELLVRTVRLIEEGKAPRTPQDDSLSSHAAMLSKEDERIDWQESAQAIHNRVRGLNPWPVAHTLYQDKRLKVWQTKTRESRFDAEPGSVVAVDRQGIWLATGRGELCLREVQPEGKARMEATAFARGYQITPGLRLG